MVGQRVLVPSAGVRVPPSQPRLLEYQLALLSSKHLSYWIFCYTHSMTKQKKTFNKNTLLATSLITNVILILVVGAYVVGAMLLKGVDLNIAQFNALQAEMCGEKYEKYIQQWGEAHGEDGKKQFAATVCLRDYKTGKDLDLEPLLTP